MKFKIIYLLTYSKQIAIYKLKVEKRTIKTYLQFISIEKETIFKQEDNQLKQVTHSDTNPRRKVLASRPWVGVPVCHLL